MNDTQHEEILMRQRDEINTRITRLEHFTGLLRLAAVADDWPLLAKLISMICDQGIGINDVLDDIDSGKPTYRIT